MSPQSDATNFIGHLFDDAAQSDNGAKNKWERKNGTPKHLKKEYIYASLCF